MPQAYYSKCIKTSLNRSLLVLMDSVNVKRNEEGKRRKRKNEGINRRKETLIKKAYELGKSDIALIICKHGRYTIYSSKGYASRLLSMAEIVSKAIVCTGLYLLRCQCLEFCGSRARSVGWGQEDLY